MSISWNEFKLRIGIDADPALVYQAWTTPAGLESWFLRKARITTSDPASPYREGHQPVQKGDQYEWMWHGHPDSVAHKGAILEANGRDLFRFTFSINCPVTIRLYRECDETIVELTESDFPTDNEKAVQHYVEDSKGWIFYLANLKSILEGGIDLRNRKMELKNVINS